MDRMGRPHEPVGPCLQGRFQCRSGECISISYVCDFQTHCQDNSDENWCGKITNLRNEVLSIVIIAIYFKHPIFETTCTVA